MINISFLFSIKNMDNFSHSSHLLTSLFLIKFCLVCFCPEESYIILNRNFLAEKHMEYRIFNFMLVKTVFILFLYYIRVAIELLNKLYLRQCILNK